MLMDGRGRNAGGSATGRTGGESSEVGHGNSGNISRNLPAALYCLQRFSPSFQSELLSFFKVSYHITQPSPESVAKGPVTGSLHPAKVRFSCWFRLFSHEAITAMTGLLRRMPSSPA